MISSILRLNIIRFSVLFLLIAAYHDPIVLFGAGGTIKGRVIELETKKPLFGANVIIRGTFLGSSTNKEGIFEIKNVPAGSHQLTVSMIGYETKVLENVRSDISLQTNVIIELKQQDINFEESVIVTAERMLIEKNISSSMHYVTGEEIKNLPIDNFKEAVALQPGVTSDGHIRGGRETEILYLIDGVGIREFQGGSQAMELPRSAVTDLTVQTGGFDVEYSNAMSGVVNIRTKSGSDKLKAHVEYYSDEIGGEETDRLRNTELSFGTPLFTDRLRFYGAVLYQESNTRWGEALDTLRSKSPHVSYSSIGKLDYLWSPSLKLTFQVMASDWDELIYEHRWRKNLGGLQTSSRHSERYDVTLTHNINQTTFYRLRASRFSIVSTKKPNGSSEELNPENDIYQYDLLLKWIIRGKRLWWQSIDEKRNYFKFDLTTKALENHEFKIGAEANLYDISNDNVLYEPQFNFWGKPLVDEPLLDFSTKYNYKPLLAAAFLQDKIKLGTANINLGIRYDVLDPKAKRPKIEITEPTLVDSLGIRRVTEYVDASVKSQFSPRFGFSVPATDKDLLFFNYGYFFQVPLFEYLYNGLDIDFRKGVNPLVGDPDLKNEQTISYEIGIKHLLTSSALLSFTFFNKDIYNLIDTKTFLASDSKREDDGFTQYVNLAFANSKGWEAVFKKIASPHLFGQVSYTYMVARGTSSSATSGYNYTNWGFEVPPEEYFLSWDQRHTFSLSMGLSNFKKWNFTVVYRWESARPFTYFPSRDGFTALGTRLVPNNRRMEPTSTLNLKLLKTVNIGNLSLEIFFDGRNLLDRNNLIWVDSSGKKGGELIDPAAWGEERRMRLGVSLKL